MTISCDCSIDVDSPASVECSITRRARKSHTCCECGETIQPGAHYEHASGCWDGSWDSFKTCAPCLAIRERYCPHGWIYGELAERLHDCLGFDYRFVPEGEEEP